MFNISLHLFQLWWHRHKGRVPQNIFAILFVLSVVPSPVLASSCRLSKATTWYNTLFAGAYQLQFDDHDPPGPHGYRWVSNTAMRVLRPDGSSCMAADNVGIVTVPLYVAAGHYLYIDTYSGSEDAFFVVDARNCATIWQSPEWAGTDFHRTATGFYIPEVGWLKIGPDCLPETISGKPVSSLRKSR